MADLSAYCRADVVGSPLHYPVQVATSSNSIPPTQDKPIQGEMLTVRNTITLEMWENIPHDVIKQDMMRKLVEELMKSKHIEFTMMKDTSQRDEIKIAARVFVTPDSQVRLLRERGY